MNLTIATINAWGLPWPFSIHKKKRLALCAQIISTRNIDLAALQEIWQRRDITALQRLLPAYHIYAEPNALFNPSGLVWISRTPLTEVVYTPFTMPSWHKEIPSKKGMLRAMWGSITLINTHMYFGGKSHMTDYQQQQITELVRKLPATPTILFGDFNLSHDQLPLPKGYRVISGRAALTVNSNTYYAQKRFNKVNGSSRTPDIVFANFPVTISRTYTVTDPLISDHFPSVVELDMQ